MNAQALVSKGFVELQTGLFIRLKRTGSHVAGVALWDHDGTTLFAGARVGIATARKLVLRLARQVASGNTSRRRKARKLLSAVLARNLVVAGVGDLEDDETLDHDAADLIAHFQEAELVGGFGDRFRKGLRKLKNGINRLARKAAKNKVVQKLRNGYAKVVEGPVGKVAAKTVATALSAFGVPPIVTETAVRAHLRSEASRMREGGYAGVLDRLTAKRTLRKGLRSLAKKEGRRFGGGLKGAAKEKLSSLTDAASLANMGAGLGLF